MILVGLFDISISFQFQNFPWTNFSKFGGLFGLSHSYLQVPDYAEKLPQKPNKIFRIYMINLMITITSQKGGQISPDLITISFPKRISKTFLLSVVGMSPKNVKKAKSGPFFSDSNLFLGSVHCDSQIVHGKTK